MVQADPRLDAAGLLEVAERMVDRGEGAPGELTPEDRRRLAWMLKDVCDAAWSSEPQRAARAADAVRRLLGTTDAPDAPEADEIGAVAAWTAGIAHLTRGEMGSALTCLDEAAHAFRARGEAHRVAETQVSKIVALAMLGRHPEAIACAGAAHDSFMALGDRRAAAKVSLNLGSLHLRRDAYAEAVGHYRAAAVLFARVGDHERSIMADIGMADALTAFGDFDEAARIYARAGMRASAHGYPVLEAIQEESVALLELARGRYREALAGFEGSRRRYEALAMPAHLAIAEKQLADAYLELRLVPEALALYADALGRFEAQEMPDDLAWSLAQRGRGQALLGDLDAARESLLRAEAMFAAQGNVVGRAAVTLARAELALASGDFDEARARSGEAAESFAATGLAERSARAELVHSEAVLHSGGPQAARQGFERLLARSRELELRSLEVRCHDGIGAAALAAGDRSGALESFNAAVAAFEQQRSALPGDDLRSAFLADHLRPYRELLRIALADHSRAPSSASAGDVLLRLDRFRARTLSERLGQGAAAADDAATRDLRSRLAWLHRRVQRVEDESGAATNLVADLRRAEHELLERVRRRGLASSGEPRFSQGGDELDPELLQGQLGTEDALVEYGVVDDELFACVVTRADITVHRQLARWPEVVDALRSARFQIETLRHGAAPVAQHVASLSQRARARMGQLYRLVWAGLAERLVASRRVLIVPHGALAALPFAALHDGSSYLGERFELALAGSARLALHGLARAPVPAREAAVFGAAEALPHALAEASFVAGLFPNARLFVGEDATIDALVSACAGADILHLACHAQFRSDNAMFSSLYLHDGTLSVEMAERLRLRPGIAVLSGCETGLAQEAAGDEIVGLVRAFLIAGAARVVASLWPVDDAVTADMMSRFYGALREGAAPAAALRAAQAHVRAQHEHPFYWAPFALHGGW